MARIKRIGTINRQRKLWVGIDHIVFPTGKDISMIHIKMGLDELLERPTYNEEDL